MHKIIITNMTQFEQGTIYRRCHRAKDAGVITDWVYRHDQDHQENRVFEILFP